MSLQRHGFTSPIRYPGGKAALSNFIKLVLFKNNLLDGHYVEVYAGGAGIAWPLLFEEYVKYVFINDISKPVYAFWQSVLQNTEELCRLINDTPVTIQEWHRQRSMQLRPDDCSSLELGFSTFFLNRTNRSGILQAGVIGGKGQSGKWKIDARFNKKDLIQRTQRIAYYASRVRLYNLDAFDFINTTLSTLSKKALVYLDPPYYMKGQELYENHYSHDDHVKLASLIPIQIKQPWIVSYDYCPQVTALYGQYRSIQYNLSYSAQERYLGSEIMFFSHSIVIPATEQRGDNFSNQSAGEFILPTHVKRADLFLSM